jgi:hypothetical protein
MERARECSCAKSDPPSAVSIAVAILLAIVAIYLLSRWLSGTRDGFVSKRAQEVYQASQELFSRTGGNASFSEFKTVAPGAEAVLYTDARGLYKQGRLSPEAVEKVL